MSEETNKLLIGVATGALVGALLVGLVLWEGSDDEDRPPIIVRGGSLIFESGDATKPGKSWKEKVAGKDWIADQAKGHHVSTFVVTFDGGSGACGSVYAPELTVYYKPSSGSPNTSTFTVARQPDGKKKYETVISGGGLAADNTATYPTLTAAGESKDIVRVDYKTGPSTIATCTTPAKVTIEMVR